MGVDRLLASNSPADDCPLCGGTGWVAVPDPLFDDALVDERCPDCARKAKDQ